MDRGNTTNCILEGRDISELNFLTFNSIGLRNKKKRLAVFKTLKEEKVDVIALQETYLLEIDSLTIDREWGGKIFIAQGTNRSKGLMFLFSKSIEELYNIEVLFSSDRLILIKISGDTESGILVANVYAPCKNNDKISFLQEIYTTLSAFAIKYSESPLVCMGDFNCVSNNDIDIISGEKHPDRIIQAFRDFTLQLNIFDTFRSLFPTKREHTWSRGSPIVARRLDYIFVHSDLIPFLENATIKSLSFSDHRAVKVNLKFTSFKRGPGLFKMNTSLLKDPRYIDLINRTIDRTLEDNKSLDPHLLWEYLKIEIRDVTKEYSKFKQIMSRSKVKQAIWELNKLEVDLAREPSNSITVRKIIEFKKEIEIRKIEETRGAQIRSGIKWIEEGDKCNKYFLSLEKARARNNTITKLTDEHGGLKTKEEDIIKYLQRFYTDLYKETKTRDDIKRDIVNFTDKIYVPRLTHEEADICDSEISLTEILNALKTMRNGSSPGSDGIPAEFYKVFWNKIKFPLFKSYQYSLLEGKLSHTQRKGVMSLLHKGKDLNRQDIANWRPISLTNVDYKILAKTLALRLRIVINSLISKDQKGFIKGRNIAELLREIDDIVEHQKRLEASTFLLAIDFRKAFDTISAVLLRETFKLYGFGNHFCEWMDIILTERIACVKNGGHISLDFIMERGVRQGCPISPLMFILAVELLAINIRQDDTIKGIRINEVKYSIRQYADDTTLFMNDAEDLHRVLNKIQEFALFSGLSLNENKSHIMALGKKHDYDRELCGIKIVKKVKILGVYFCEDLAACENSENWLGKIENIKRILGKWEYRNLSIMGKIHIVKTFGLSQIVHIMQSISIPTSALSIVNTIFYKFVWKKKLSNKKAYEKVKRKIMCGDYKGGGLGMIDIQSMQNSFLINWANKLLNESHSEWKNIPTLICSNVGGLSIFHSNVPIKEIRGLNLIYSSFWKGVIQAWVRFRGVQQGDKELGLDEPLFNNGKIRFRGNTLFIRAMINRKLIYVRDICKNLKAINLIQFKEKYGEYNGLELDYNVVRNAIEKCVIRCITNDGLSRQEGKLERKQIYNQIKPVDEVAHIRSFWEKKCGWNDSFWELAFKCTGESRLRLLQWKILHNIYPTNILLHKMKISDTNKCKSCLEIDFTEHFFFYCNQVRKIWEEVENLIATILNKRIYLGVRDVMLGIIKESGIGKADLLKVNHIILVGKMVISKIKYGPKKYPLETLEHELKLRNLI